MKSKIYVVDLKRDWKKIVCATLKKVYSVTLFPRVLINIQNKKIAKNLSKKCDFLIKSCSKSQIFSKITHNKCFDIGLFFFKKDKNLCLKIYDGNGIVAGSFITNIFDFCFSLSKDDLHFELKKINRQYNALKTKNLIVQKVD